MVINDDSSKTNKIVVNSFNKSKNEKFENQTYIKAVEKPIFLISDTKNAFNYLKQLFIKASIFQLFDLKCYILIKINISSYIIDGILSQLKLNPDIMPNDLSLNKSNFGY